MPSNRDGLRSSQCGSMVGTPASGFDDTDLEVETISLKPLPPTRKARDIGPSPFLGPTPSPCPFSHSALEARTREVVEARRRATRGLQHLLQSRANSRLSSSTPVPLPEAAEGPLVPYVPAVFPFPEPIPHGPPPREPAYAQLLAARDTPSTARSPSPKRSCSVTPSSPSRRFPELPTDCSTMSEERSRMEADAKLANRRRANAWISECRPEVFLFEHEKELWLQYKNAGQRKRRAHDALLRSMSPMPFDEWEEVEQQAQAEREHSLQEKAQAQIQKQLLEAQKGNDVGRFLQQQLSADLAGKLHHAKLAKLPSRKNEHAQPEAAIGGLMKAKALAKKAGSQAANNKAQAVQKEIEAGGAQAWAERGKR